MTSPTSAKPPWQPAHPFAPASSRCGAKRNCINTGVAIHNLEASPELVRCELRRNDVLGVVVSILLAANGQTSWMSKALTTADTSDFSGPVRCTATGDDQFTAVALEMDPGGRTFITLLQVPVQEQPSRE